MKNKLRSRYGEWALITGASEGIGLACAEALAALQFNLVLVARRGERLEEIAEPLRQQHGIEVRVKPLDLSMLANNQLLCREVESLDIGLVVTSAGFGTSGEFVENTWTDEMNMTVKASCSYNFTFTRNDFCSRTNDNVYSRLSIRISCFSNMINFSIF